MVFQLENTFQFYLSTLKMYLSFEVDELGLHTGNEKSANVELNIDINDTIMS